MSSRKSDDKSGFTAEEKAAMRERAKETRRSGKVDAEAEVLVRKAIEKIYRHATTYEIPDEVGQM